MFATIEIIIFIVLAFMVAYVCFFSFAAKLVKGKKHPISSSRENRISKIAILVPAYKEDSIIISTAERLTRLNYTPGSFDIYIIADSLQEETIFSLQRLPVTVITVHFEKSTKTKALNAAMQQIKGTYDIALICDADNILASDFLQQINTAFLEGNKALQGRRVAKNMDSNFSILDGASEIINNHIFRKGHQAVGLSSSVIGSGMAFPYPLFREIMQHVNAVGGFDKVLQLEIVRQGISITYLENALIFDEKIPHADAFGTQRKRWLSSQFIYLKRFFLPGWKMLFRGKLDYFNLAVMHNILLPRVILLGILPMMLVISILFSHKLPIWPASWGLLCILYFTALLIALPGAFFQRQFLPALLSLPRAFIIMLKGLFNIKGADKSFIHTVHHHQDVTNVIYKTNDL